MQVRLALLWPTVRVILLWSYRVGLEQNIFNWCTFPSCALIYWKFKVLEAFARYLCFYFIISFTFPLIDCYKGKLLQGIFICFFGIFNYVYFHHIFYLVNCRNIQLKKASNWQFRIARVAISEQAYSTFWLCGTFFTCIIKVVWGPQLPRVNYNWNFYQNSVLTTLRLPNELSICVPLTSFPLGGCPQPPWRLHQPFEQQFQFRSQM